MIEMILMLLVQLLLILIQLLIVVVLVQVVLSWLVAFQIIDLRNPGVATVWRFTQVVTEPLLKPIRRIIPPISGFDLSPMVLLIALYMLQQAIPFLLLAGRV